VELEETFRRHQREIFGYLMRVTGDRALAEDLAQETFLKAFTGALGYRGEASVRTWLFTIARNTLISHQRRSRPLEVGIDDAEVAVRTDPDVRLGVAETLAALPLQHREVLVLCDLLGFSPLEAAELTGVTPNALRVRLHRARRAFREVHERHER
jgi:RNA polymerase sigma-70 factor (ECF subfamily)